jgi:hypothetical protein
VISSGWVPSYRTRTHGLWKHEMRPVWFSLVVDDFGIKYVGGENAGHLMTSITTNMRFQVTEQAVHTAE